MQSRYDASPTARTDGYSYDEQQDISGNKNVNLATDIAGENRTDGVLFNSPRAISSTTGAWTQYASAAKVGTVGINIKASAGRLRQITATNSNTVDGYYLLIIDKASAPVNNDVPVWGAALPGFLAQSIHNDCTIDFGESGLTLTNGLSYAISATEEKVTLTAAADAMVYARYA